MTKEQSQVLSAAWLEMNKACGLIDELDKLTPSSDELALLKVIQRNAFDASDKLSRLLREMMGR